MRRTVSTVVVAMLTFGLGAGTAAAAPTPFPGQLVVPAPQQTGHAIGLVASAEGIAYAKWSSSPGTVVGRVNGSASHHALGLAQTVSLVGDQVVGWATAPACNSPSSP